MQSSCQDVQQSTQRTYILNSKKGDTSAEADMQAIFDDIQNLKFLIRSVKINIGRLNAQITELNQDIRMATEQMNQACSQ